MRAISFLILGLLSLPASAAWQAVGAEAISQRVSDGKYGAYASVARHAQQPGGALCYLKSYSEPSGTTTLAYRFFDAQGALGPEIQTDLDALGIVNALSVDRCVRLSSGDILQMAATVRSSPGSGVYLKATILRINPSSGVTIAREFEGSPGTGNTDSFLGSLVLGLGDEISVAYQAFSFPSFSPSDLIVRRLSPADFTDLAPAYVRTDLALATVLYFNIATNAAGDVAIADMPSSSSIGAFGITLLDRQNNLVHPAVDVRQPSLIQRTAVLGALTLDSNRTAYLSLSDCVPDPNNTGSCTTSQSIKVHGVTATGALLAPVQVASSRVGEEILGLPSLNTAGNGRMVVAYNAIGAETAGVKVFIQGPDPDRADPRHAHAGGHRRHQRQPRLAASALS